MRNSRSFTRTHTRKIKRRKQNKKDFSFLIRNKEKGGRLGSKLFLSKETALSWQSNRLWQIQVFDCWLLVVLGEMRSVAHQSSLSTATNSIWTHQLPSFRSFLVGRGSTAKSSSIYNHLPFPFRHRSCFSLLIKNKREWGGYYCDDKNIAVGCTEAMRSQSKTEKKTWKPRPIM